MGNISFHLKYTTNIKIEIVCAMLQRATDQQLWYYLIKVDVNMLFIFKVSNFPKIITRTTPLVTNET